MPLAIKLIAPSKPSVSHFQEIVNPKAFAILSIILLTKPNTASNIVLPIYTGCDGGDPSNRVITITLN